MLPTCEVCKQQNHKYKCPKCLLKYCSVGCFKKHKEVLCNERENVHISPPDLTVKRISKPTVEHSEEREEGEISDNEDETEESEDKVPTETLQMLGESPELLSLLENPHLRQIITNLDSCENPEKDMDTAMREPIFTEFADACLEIVEPDD